LLAYIVPVSDKIIPKDNNTVNNSNMQ